MTFDVRMEAIKQSLLVSSFNMMQTCRRIRWNLRSIDESTAKIRDAWGEARCLARRVDMRRVEIMRKIPLKATVGGHVVAPSCVSRDVTHSPLIEIIITFNVEKETYEEIMHGAEIILKWEDINQ